MTAMAALRAQGPASFPQERATPPPSYSTASASPRSLPVAPRRTTRGAFRPLSCPTLGGAGPAALPAVHHYHEGPDFSLRVDPAFRTLPYSSVYPSGSSAPTWQHEHHPRGRNEISPGQTLLGPSVPARISALMADQFAMASASATARDGHPALLVARATRPPGSARPLVYASPLRGCGGTLTRKRNALLGAQPGLCAKARAWCVTRAQLGTETG